MSRNGIYNIAGQVVRTAVGLVTIRYLVKFAGLDEYGVWTLASALIGLAALAEPALNLTTTVFVARESGRDDAAPLSAAITFLSMLALGIACVVSIAVYFCANAIAARFPSLSATQVSELAAAIQLGAVWVLLRVPQHVALGVQQAFHRYGPMNLLLTAQSVVANVGMIVLAQQGARTPEFMRWQVIVSAVALPFHAAYAVALLRPHRVRPRWDNAVAREVGTHAGWTALTTLGTQLFSQADRLIVGEILGAAAAGVYGAITAVAAQINSLSAMGVQPLLPEISRLTSAEHAAAARPRLRRALEINALVALALAAVLFAFPQQLLALILPDVPATELIFAFRAAMVIYALYSLNATGYLLCLGLNAARETAAIVVCSAVLALSLIAVGALRFGLDGAVLGNTGYQLAWLLTVLGMRYGKVPAATWLSWLARPLFAFAAALGLSVLLPNAAWRALAVGLSIVGMFGLSAFRVALLNKLWRVRCIVNSSPARFTLPDGSAFEYLADSVIGFCLFNGTFETAELRFIQERLQAGDIFVDIGANGGIYTVVAARKVGASGRVVAFEPDPRNIEILKRNLALNNLTNVTIVAKAVSNTAGSASLAISRDGAMNSLAKTSHAGQRIEKWETVETTTLDAVLREQNVTRVDVIKIDVEGAERLVLEGARDTLAANRNVTILFEATDLAARSFNYSARDILNELAGAGFGIRYFEGERLTQPESLDDPRLGRDVYNFVAARTPAAG